MNKPSGSIPAKKAQSLSESKQKTPASLSVKNNQSIVTPRLTRSSSKKSIQKDGISNTSEGIKRIVSSTNRTRTSQSTPSRSKSSSVLHASPPASPSAISSKTTQLKSIKGNVSQVKFPREDNTPKSNESTLPSKSNDKTCQPGKPKTIYPPSKAIQNSKTIRLSKEQNSLSFPACSECMAKTTELQRITKLFGDLKEKCRREEGLVNELMRANTQNTKSITILEAKNAALLAKIKTLESQRGFAKKDSNSNDILNDDREKKICKLSQSELKFDTRNINDKYIPLLLAVRNQATNAVYNELTESFLKLKQDGSYIRCRNWKGRCEVFSSIQPSKCIGHPQITLDENSDDLAVPSCPVQYAEEGSYFRPSGQYPSSMIQDAAWTVVSSKSAFTKYRSEEAWKEAVKIVTSDAVTCALFEKTLQSKLSNHKRSCKKDYFKSLGYDILFSGKNEDKIRRQEQRVKVIKKFLSDISDDQKDAFLTIQSTLDDNLIDNLDCSKWRTSPFDTIFNDDSDVVEPSFEYFIEPSIDLLFQNNAARKAYVMLTGYAPKNDDSIITLARADSWFTTNVALINVLDGKGGKRNSLFQQYFSRLLPVSMKNILVAMRDFIISRCPKELEIRDTSEFVPTLECPTEFQYAFRVNDRKVTRIVLLPSMNYYYLYIDSRWFMENICSWLKIIDVYIGKAKEDDMMFHSIVDQNHLNNETGVDLNTMLNFPNDNDKQIRHNSEPSSTTKRPLSIGEKSIVKRSRVDDLLDAELEDNEEYVECPYTYEEDK